MANSSEKQKDAEAKKRQKEEDALRPAYSPNFKFNFLAGSGPFTLVKQHGPTFLIQRMDDNQDGGGVKIFTDKTANLKPASLGYGVKHPYRIAYMAQGTAPRVPATTESMLPEDSKVDKYDRRMCTASSIGYGSTHASWFGHLHGSAPIIKSGGYPTPPYIFEAGYVTPAGHVPARAH